MKEHIYERDGLTWSVVQTIRRATIAWRGIADSRFPGQFLDPLIAEWGEKLSEFEVTLDLRGLEFMNSATVRPLISLIRRLDENGKAVRVLFLDVEWQRIHGNCMCAVARTLKNVRIERQSAP